ncbi:MAG: MFS transporter [Deltaproteobacteria bacterium]|nr:MFS transporter [Deltaproteobacteria bacterium]
MTDRTLLLASAFARALGVGMIGVLLGLHLAAVPLDVAAIGVVVAAGLAGGALASLLVTLAGDRIGRRRTLVLLAVATAAGGIALACVDHPAALAIAAFLGMANGMGRDRGAALVVEQAILPATTDDAGRTRAFAWYNVLQDAGHALGSVAAGLPVLLERGAGLAHPAALRASVLAYAALALASVGLYLGLSPAVEHMAPARLRVSPATRGILAKLCALFALDALGGGFLTTALLSWFFATRFGASAATIGALFFLARVANALSHFGAAWLARRIGLVNTMVFTHIPSSLLLVTVAIAPSFWVAAVLFVLREGLVEMDVPTRQSYVMAVVAPQERTIASGVTSLVRLGAWAVAPSFAGLFLERGSLAAPLVAGAAMKITYDLLLWRAFRGVPPPEERAA